VTSFRLHDSWQIAHVEIAIELSLCLFLSGQFALPSQLRQLVHACDIAFAKTKRRSLLQTSSPASAARTKLQPMARVSFKTVSACGVTPTTSFGGF
jgi:hypothetical protein